MVVATEPRYVCINLAGPVEIPHFPQIPP